MCHLHIPPFRTFVHNVLVGGATVDGTENWSDKKNEAHMALQSVRLFIIINLWLNAIIFIILPGQ